MERWDVTINGHDFTVQHTVHGWKITGLNVSSPFCRSLGEALTWVWTHTQDSIRAA